MNIDNNYFQIHGWMVTKLGLKSIERDVYAIIYGFSQDGESDYHGNLKYIADLTGYSKNSICTALKSLTEKGLLIKNEEFLNNIKFCSYMVNLDTIQALCTPIQALCMNNNIINKSNNNILSKDNTSEQEFSFGNVEEPKKQNLYQKCLALIDEWTNLPSIRDLLIQYLKFCLEIKSIRGANQWKGMLNTLERVQQQCHPHTFEEIIEQSLNRGWKTFYPISDYQKPKSPYIYIQKSNDYIAPDDNELVEAKNEDGSLKEY